MMCTVEISERVFSHSIALIIDTYFDHPSFFFRKFVQVVGKVKSNDEIEAHYIIPGDDNFNMENYNAAIVLSHSDKLKDLFQ